MEQETDVVLSSDCGYSHFHCLLPSGYDAVIFKLLEEKVERFDYDFQRKCVKERDFEAPEMYVMELLMGVK